MSSSGTQGYHFGAAVMVGYTGADGRGALRGTIYGTAFPISGGYWLTAGHVVEAFTEKVGLVPFLLLYSPEGKFKVAPVKEWEVLKSDIAILKVEYQDEGADTWLPHRRWASKSLLGFQEVRTVGYPFGFRSNGTEQFIVARGFQGYVVTQGSPFQFPTTGVSAPVYELSFAAPQGLSGSALLSAEVPLVCGMIIGNTEESMLVYSNREVVEEENETTIVEQYAKLTLGIAVKGIHIMTMSSKLLGSTIEEHLRKNNLVA